MKSAEEVMRALAEEEGVTENELVEMLVRKEDRRRHVMQEPFQGERRAKCGRENCAESQERFNLREIMEV